MLHGESSGLATRSDRTAGEERVFQPVTFDLYLWAPRRVK
jgi:hypothetical protein